MAALLPVVLRQRGGATLATRALAESITEHLIDLGRYLIYIGYEVLLIYSSTRSNDRVV